MGETRYSTSVDMQTTLTRIMGVEREADSSRIGPSSWAGRHSELVGGSDEQHLVLAEFDSVEGWRCIVE